MLSSQCAHPQDMSDIDEFRWKNRLILLFTSQVDDPLFQQQYDLLRADPSGLDERDLLIFRVLPNRIISESDTAGAARADNLRERYRADGEDFLILLIGKDGSEKLRSDTVVSRQALYERIDAMPMRREEMRRN